MLTERELQEANAKYDSLQFKDDFLFCKILTENPDIAKDLVELILDTKISKVVPQNQKSIELTANGRGVRLDVYLDDDQGTVYDLEMQTTQKKDLPKRTRYYQGMIDLNLINRGASFNELKKTYIIFICTNDPFKEGRHIYSFENLCKEIPGKRLGDEAYKVILNAAGTQTDVSENLMDFFNFILTGKGESELSHRLENEVQKAKVHSEWRTEYMTLYMRDRENFEQGVEQGIEQGIVQNRFDTIQLLVKSGMQLNDKAMTVLGVSEEEYQEAKESLS